MYELISIAALIYLFVKSNNLQRQVTKLKKHIAQTSKNNDVSADAIQDKPSQPLHKTENFEPITQTTFSASEASSDEPPDESMAPPSGDTEKPNDKPWLVNKTSELPKNTLPAKAIQPKFSRTVTAKIDDPINRFLGERLNHVKRYFTEGNIIVRVGVVVLFVGVAFLLRYASVSGALPIQLRVVGVAIAGMALLLVGWRLRHKKSDYALVLQGAGIGVVYLTVFAALKLYELLPAGFVLVCLVFMVAFSAVLAVLQNAKTLAVLAVTGGFLAPILTSTGGGSHIALFSFYAILNVGIVAIAFYKSWRLLNLLGFVFTFVIGFAWGVKYYLPEYFLSTEIFLSLFYIFYLVISVLYAFKQPPKLKGVVDGSLVFGLPVVAFSLQASLVNHIEYALAFSSFVLAALYLFLAQLLWRRGGEPLRMLAESFLALALIFISLVIPFALDGEWIASAWALEGAGLLWVSLKQKRSFGVFMGLALQIFGALAYVCHTFYLDVGYFTSSQIAMNSFDSTVALTPVLNHYFFGALIIAVTSVFSSFYLMRHSPVTQLKLERLSVPFLIWGVIWWLVNGMAEIDYFLPFHYRVTVLVLFIALTSAVLLYLEHRFTWRVLRFNAICVLVSVPVLFFYNVLIARNVFGHLAWLSWCMLFAVIFISLRYWDVCISKNVTPNIKSRSRWHVIAISFATWIFTYALHEFFSFTVQKAFNLGEVWSIAIAALPSLFVVWLLSRTEKFAANKVWPFVAHEKAYALYAILVSFAYLCVWSILTNFNVAGDPYPLLYVVLINPIDLVQIACILTVILWWRKARIPYGEHSLFKNNRGRFLLSVIGMVGFIQINAMLIRSLHHWAGVEYTLYGVIHSNVAQAGLSVLWTLIGLVIMMLSSKKEWRTMWIVAAALLGVTVAKLFFVDLSDRNALVTIFSFIAVGALLLVVGYFSPMPPISKSDISPSDFDGKTDDSEGEKNQTSEDVRNARSINENEE